MQRGVESLLDDTEEVLIKGAASISERLSGLDELTLRNVNGYIPGWKSYFLINIKFAYTRTGELGEITLAGIFDTELSKVSIKHADRNADFFRQSCIRVRNSRIQIRERIRFAVGSWR